MGGAEDVVRPGGTIETDIPARLDRLPWGGFHRLVIVALGITWVLDGLEVTLAGSVSGALQKSPALHLSDSEIGLAGSFYLAGAVGGAFLFGWLTDKLGRKKLFNITLGLYLISTALTAFSWDFASFAAFRFLTGAGIGGEYTAINSAIQELIPARFRGKTDLFVNGSFWVGAALGAGGSVGLLRNGWLPSDYGWRFAFGIGSVLGIFILFLRHFVPESPRWLLLHGRVGEAEQVMEGIEARVAKAEHTDKLPEPEHKKLKLTVRENASSMLDLARTLTKKHPGRAFLCLVLMASQAFFYNAIFFTYALVLGHFYQVPADDIGLYILPFAGGNFLGPLLLGPLFDSWGRKPMIAGTYAISGLLLLVTAWLFAHGHLDARGQTIAWCIVFFFASAASSAAYLTVSESFPLEIRALAIALFYAIGTAIGGISGPVLFGSLIGTGSKEAIAWGYAGGAVLMLVAAATELVFGIAAERRSLEDVATPALEHCLMAANPAKWAYPTPKGFYVEPGDFYIDPVRPVDRAIITHGHSDHARPDHENVLATPETLAIMRARMGERSGKSQQALAYGEPIALGGVSVRLVPAGHVLGSAQVVLEYGGCRLVASGDYKRRADPTCPPFEPVKCDVFITEATFGLPVFRHPPDAHEIGKLLHSVSLYPDRVHLVGAYALGKCQRVIALLRQFGYTAPIYLHGAQVTMTKLYESFGIDLGELFPAAGLPRDQLKGQILLAPPGALADLWARKLPDPVLALASGWMRVKQRGKARGIELPLVISDHADWDELCQTMEDVEAGQIWVTHGNEEALVRQAALTGRKALALNLVGFDDDDDQ